MFARKSLFLLCACFAIATAGAQEMPLASYYDHAAMAPHVPQPTAQPADTTKEKTPFSSLPIKPTKREPLQSKPLSLRAIVIPSAMIAYGAFTLSNKDLKNLNLTIREKVWEDRNNGHGKKLPIDDFTIVAPAVAVYALNLTGVKGKSNFIDRSLIYGMSNLIGTGIVKGVKNMALVMRPDSSNRLSFPSGHTTKAFIAAEFLRQEYKGVSPWYGIAGYAVAAGTGFLRMYNNKHWLNDVIAGAGVGILSTRVSYWLYPKIKNAFFKNAKGKTVIMPTYQNQSFGIGMVHQFH